jgi:hypothetical protein
LEDSVSRSKLTAASAEASKRLTISNYGCAGAYRASLRQAPNSPIGAQPPTADY